MKALRIAVGLAFVDPEHSIPKIIKNKNPWLWKNTGYQKLQRQNILEIRK
jgi:hypothetical protein